MSSKKTPGINSTSTADIAFLLLCYFLMSSSMGSRHRIPASVLLPDEFINGITVRIVTSSASYAC